MLTGPDKYVEAWMKDLNADELRMKVEALQKQADKLERGIQNSFELIRELNPSPEVKKIYAAQLNKWQKEWDAILPELQRAQSDYETVKE